MAVLERRLLISKNRIFYTYKTLNKAKISLRNVSLTIFIDFSIWQELQQKHGLQESIKKKAKRDKGRL